MNRIVVTSGLIQGRLGTLEADLYLVSKRPAGTHLAHAWEFPGGKVEPGEDPEVGLIRELQEELGVEVEVGDIFAVGHHVYPEKEVILLVYACRITAGEPACLEVAEIAWLTLAELAELPLPPADRPAVARLRRMAAAEAPR